MENNQTKKIDPNQDDIDTLQQLPGVGRKLAERIYESRPYQTPEDLQKVKGVGSGAIERWKDSLQISTSAESAPIEEPPSITPITIQEPVLEEEEEGKQPHEQPEQQIEEEIEQAVDQPLEHAEDQQEEAFLEEPTVEQPSAVVEPAASAAPPKGYVTRGQALLGMVVTGFLSTAVAVVLLLGILAGLNNGQLQFASPSQVTALSTQTRGLEARLDSLVQDTQGLRSRLDNLEGLGSRVSTVEKAAADLQDELKSVSTQIDAVETEVSGLQEKVDAVAKQTEQFSNFLENLRSLLNDMATGGNP